MGFRQAPSLPYHDLGIVEDGTTASQAISKGSYVIWKGKNYFSSANILQGATLEEDVNLTAISDGVINGIVSALNNKLTKYSSTDEIEVGTWIDGRKIYRKVFTGNVGSSVGTTTISTGGIIPKVIVRFEPILYSDTSSGWISGLPGYSGSDPSNMIKAYWNNNGIIINNQVSGYTGMRLIIITEYVKDDA